MIVAFPGLTHLHFSYVIQCILTGKLQKKENCDETNKIALNLQTAIAKENFKLNNGGLSQRQASNQSGKPGTIRETNQASGVRKAHYAKYYVRKSSILLAAICVMKFSSVARDFSHIKFIFLITRKINQQNK